MKLNTIIEILLFIVLFIWLMSVVDKNGNTPLLIVLFLY